MIRYIVNIQLEFKIIILSDLINASDKIQTQLLSNLRNKSDTAINLFVQNYNAL